MTLEFEIRAAVSSFPPLSRLSDRRESVKNEETAARISNSTRHSWVVAESEFHFAVEISITEENYPLIDKKSIEEKEELFPNNFHPVRSEAAVREYLRRQGLDRVDLLVAHFPVNDVNNNEQEKSFDVEDVWRGLESIYDMNLTRAIGVSNFSADQIERIMKIAVWPIHTAQSEENFDVPIHDLVEVCNKHGIPLTTHGSSVKNPSLHFTCSLTGQSDERVRGMKRRILHPDSPTYDIFFFSTLKSNEAVSTLKIEQMDVETTLQNESVAAALSRALPFTRLSPSDSILMICDLQEKFRPSIIKFNEVVTVASRLVAAASMLEMPKIATEQYPRGLGHTVPELNLPEATPVFDKTKFSMCIPSVDALLSRKSPKSVILCGVEAHVCVLQTALDLLERGISVHVVVDATSSRSAVDRTFAFKHLERAGAVLTTSECVILGLCGGADHPKFKQIQKIIMEQAPYTGLSLASI
uniref:Isochorismatase domain-containing protein 1 n=1 Tax=Pristionchus pacificus TaxID=54126 RepID=A0A2A6C6Q8_PRIPA|eukprot:PDM73865.1 hypothetical protein PRIPAC_41221 [Pristionchus pacificus]